jgi:hypothetical protein
LGEFPRKDKRVQPISAKHWVQHEADLVRREIFHLSTNGRFG